MSTPTPVLSPWARAWCDRIGRGEATAAACRTFAGMLGGPLATRRQTTARPGEIDAHARALAVAPVRLPERDTARGLEWLARWGGPRLHLPEDFRPVSFLYAGGAVSIDNGPPLPEWVVIGEDGRRIAYYAASWQRRAWPIGGGPYIDPEGWAWVAA